MQLAYAKFHHPRPIDSVCQRDRLVPNRLASLTVIHAPPGYGKTTLASQIIDRGDVQGCWMSIDEFDNNPRQFWGAVVGSLQTALPKLGQQSLQLLNDEALGLHDVVVALLNELNSLLTSSKGVNFVLVLDDFHLITHPALLESLNLFLDYLPASLRILITSRSIPQLKLAHRKSKGKATEITSQDLKFTPSEAVDFFACQHLQLDPQILSGITERCEGWAAALKLYSLAKNAGTAVGLSDRVNQDIYELLLGEVLHGLPTDIQNFISQTAFLPRFSAALTDQVLQHQGGQDAIDALVRMNLFVVALDDEKTWYRYHDLFKALVGARFGPSREQLDPLRQRAGHWFETQGHHREAMDQYLQAQDWSQACRLLAKVGPIWTRQGLSETLRHWLNQIPDAEKNSHAELLCLQVWIAPDAEKYAQGPVLLNQANALIDEGKVPPEKLDAVRCEVLTLQALVARLHGQWDKTLLYSQAALQSVEVARLSLRWRTHLTLGACAYTQGALVEAEHQLQDAVVWALKEQHLYGVAQSCGYLSEVLYQQGQLQKAQRMALQVKHELESTPMGAGRLAAWRLIGLVDLMREQDRLEEASATLAELRQLRSLESCESLQHQIILLRTYTLAISQRDADAAEQAINEIEAVQMRMRFNSVYAFGSLDGLRAEVAWLRGDTIQITHWLERHLQRVTLAAVPFFLERDELTAIRILAQLNRHEECLERVQHLRMQAMQAGHRVTHALCLIWQAVCLHAQAQPERARSHMLEAVSLMAGEGFQRLFLDQGTAIDDVLALCGDDKVYGPFARELRQKLKQEQTCPKGSSIQAMSPPTAIPGALSPRELELLGYVRDGFADKEIARLAHISTGTVKTHLRNIYRKLEAKGRVQALAKLHLLTDTNSS